MKGFIIPILHIKKQESNRVKQLPKLSGSSGTRTQGQSNSQAHAPLSPYSLGDLKVFLEF